LWTALYSVSLFGVLSIVKDLDFESLKRKLTFAFPRKAFIAYLSALGLVLLFGYLSDVGQAAVTGIPPAALDHYTTLELASLELGIMVPLHFLGAVLLWRKQAGGLLLALLLSFAAAMAFVALTIGQAFNYFQFHQNTLMDVLFPMMILLVASGFSVAAFMQWRDE
jgi:hypothetical protein